MINLRKDVVFLDGLVFEQDSDECIRAACKRFCLECEVRFAAFAYGAECAGDGFEGVHIHIRKHFAKCRSSALREQQKRARILWNGVDVFEERVVLPPFCIFLGHRKYLF